LGVPASAGTGSIAVPLARNARSAYFPEPFFGGVEKTEAVVVGFCFVDFGFFTSRFDFFCPLANFFLPC
jgi:hypothetical protein